MRISLVLILSICVGAVRAQTNIPSSYRDYRQHQIFNNKKSITDSSTEKKWSLQKYSGISTSFSFFKGGSATVVSAPMGLQLNRRINNNFYAFAGVSIAPAYINFHGSFPPPVNGKSYPGNAVVNGRSFDMFSRAEMGLMYVNDNKTFSISGSIGIERSTYPAFPYNQLNTTGPIIPYQPVKRD